MSRRRLRFVWGSGLACVALAGILPLGAAVVQMPDDAFGGAGGSVSVPVLALPADGILGADIRFFYNPAVLTPTGVATTTITQTGFSVTPNFTVAGRVILSIFGAAPMSGSGAIVTVQFNVVGSPGATSGLDLTVASLNEGAIPSTLDDGLFTVCAVVDTDGDTILDCADPDDDGDGVADGLDCAPLNALVAAPPVEVVPVTFAASPKGTLEWTTQGPAARYDIVGAEIADLRGPGAASAECLQDDVTGPSWLDPAPQPANNSGYYYLVRAENDCGSATYGYASSGAERFPGVDCAP